MSKQAVSLDTVMRNWEVLADPDRLHTIHRWLKILKKVYNTYTIKALFIWMWSPKTC